MPRTTLRALAATVQARARRALRQSSGHALLHAVTAITSGLVLIVEPPGGYMLPVYAGPTSVLAWTGQPLAAWGALMLALGAVVLALGGRPPSRWVLAHLAGVWGTFGGSALWVGITSDQAGSLGGVAWLALAAGCVRAVLAFDQQRLTPPCPLREDCQRLPYVPAPRPSPGGPGSARR